MAVRKHYRRRAVIALLAAVLMFGASRLADRPMDSRFVGKWTVDNGAVAPSWPAPRVEFRADGTATWWSSNVPLNRIYSPYPLRWSSDKNRIIWRHEYGSLYDAIYGEYDRLRYRFRDRTAVAPHEVVYDVVEVTQNEMQVDIAASGKSKLRWILRRAD